MSMNNKDVLNEHPSCDPICISKLQEASNATNCLTASVHAVNHTGRMTFAILVVCLTAPKLSKSCQLKFQTIIDDDSFTHNSNPYFLVTGDFNHDNLLDIVVANSGTNSIGIFLNYGNKTFASQMTFSTEDHSRPISVATGDFNNDTHLDIAVANYDSHNIGIFLGYGNGSFANQTTFSTGASHPVSIAVGDLNNDHWLDIVVANNGTNNIGILLGYENGSFGDPITYFTGYDSFPHFIAIDDLNNDHNLDIVVANYGTNNVGVFLGYGNGNFTPQIIYSTSPQSGPYSIVVNDFNKDGQLDIAVANSGKNNVGIFLGYRNGTFTSQTTYSISPGSRPQSIIVGDFNQDNELDIAVSNHDTNNICVLVGYGNGSFAIPTMHSTDTDSIPFAMTVGDFDNNNQSDIAVANFGTNNILMLIGYVLMQSKSPTAYSTGIGSLPYHITIGDINNDTNLDLVVANSGTGTLGIFLGYGNGSFQEQITYPSTKNAGVRGLILSDLDEDHQLDIVVANSNDETLGILYGYGNGSFTSVVTYFTGSPSSPRWITINDFNNDNHLDIVFTDQVSGYIGIFLGYGNRTFGNLMRFFFGHKSQLFGIAAGDFNHDDNLDVAVADYGTGNIGIFLGSGNGSFTLFTLCSTGDKSHVSSVTVVDLNNDTYLDFVVTNSATNNIGVFFGFGNGSFDKQLLYSTGMSSGSSWISVADFNNDGSLDLAVANPLTNNVGILLGNRQGYFTNQTIYLTGLNSKPYSIAVGDFNKDNQLDIAVANYGSNNVAILLGHPIKNSSNQTTNAIDNNSQVNYNSQSNSTITDWLINDKPILLGDYYAGFQSQTIYSTGFSSNPYSIAIGDLNNDTHMDIVVTNSGNENLGVFLGYGNGSFATQIIYPIGVGSSPGHVIIDDFNRDNWLDVAITDGNDDNLIILLGNGSGTFSTQLTYFTGSRSKPSALAVGYFNNDKYLDLVVANKEKDTIGIFFGLDYTFFKNQESCDAGKDSSPDSLAVGDFNNDGHLDMVTTLYYGGKLGVFLGYGNGSFTSLSTYSDIRFSQPRAVTVGDVNNDNQLDIIAAKRGINSISVVLGHGNGTFADPLLYSTGPNTRPRSVAAGDFNHDNCLDVTVANYGANNIGVFFGYGNGTFQNVIALSTGKRSRPNSVTVFDINNDTHLDIIVVNRGIDQVGVFLGYGNTSFTQQMTFSTGADSSPTVAIARDFDKDGKVDLAIANYGTSNVVILYGYENGAFRNSRIFTTGTNFHPEQMEVGDFNNDNQLDIIVIDSNSQYVGVFFSYNDGTFASISLVPLEEIASSIGYVAVGDFNNDTRLDFALADYGNNYIQVYLANGTKPFTGQTMFYDVDQGARPSALAVGHFNNDSHLDLVIANYGTNNIGILFGYGNRMFSNVRTYSTGDGSHPLSLTVGDFNNDSLTDIIVANYMADNIIVFIGLGNEEFFILTTYSMGHNSHPMSIAVGDFNRDYKKDIAVTNFGTNNICILFGYDNGTFTNQTWYPLGYDSRPTWIVFKDLNNDTWDDIAVATYGIDNIKILLNLC
ncbi:unnamed protein product [Rotaria sordida]|uniref:Uncharacterized protein n=1 Tax=Rotaria sordida TaxID=392033 RepID=A0A814LGR7_9BILA|nr:unnamed protein product [Rotaria sordida]CAF1243901.1 unnamed protein product [Rotaria sordida]